MGGIVAPENGFRHRARLARSIAATRFEVRLSVTAAVLSYASQNMHVGEHFGAPAPKSPDQRVGMW